MRLGTSKQSKKYIHWVRAHSLNKLLRSVVSLSVCGLACFIARLTVSHVGSYASLSSAAHTPFLTVPAASVLSDSFLACMKDVGQHPSINEVGELVAHQLMAGRFGLWNQDVRFAAFGDALPDSPVILEVGGHTHAADSRQLLHMFPRARIHIYEPILSYFKELEKNWKDAHGDVEIHGVGLGNRSRTVRVSAEDLIGEGTFIMDSGGGDTDGKLEIQVVDAYEELSKYAKATEASSNKAKIDLLQVNCEGCEWEMFVRLIQTNVLQHVGVLQISFHNYGSERIGALLPQYCLIREALEKTHDKVVAAPFAWERWVLRVTDNLNRV